MEEMVMVMEIALRDGLDLTMAADASFVVFSVVLLSKGRGAFTFYTGFDEPNPTPGRTAGRYGRSVVPQVVKFFAT